MYLQMELIVCITHRITCIADRVTHIVNRVVVLQIFMCIAN